MSGFQRVAFSGWFLVAGFLWVIFDWWFLRVRGSRHRVQAISLTGWFQCVTFKGWRQEINGFFGHRAFLWDQSRVFVVRRQKYCQCFCVIYYGTDPGGYFLLVFLRCEDETILPGFRVKVGGLLHRSRENATFSAIIPEFCSVSRGVLQ